MRYLVTGGAGFIGSNLVKELINRRNNVLVVDNLSTGNLENLKAVKRKMEFLKMDSGDILWVAKLKEINGIFHLGIPSSSPMYKENHSLTGKSINEFINVLELSRRENCKLVYASSSSLYNGSELPFREEAEIIPADFYTEARYVMERLAEMYYKMNNVRSIGLRLFSIYGPGERYKGKYANLVSQFLWAMQKGKCPLIYGDGAQTRDFVFIEDAVRAFVLAMESPDKFNIFNVGRGENYTLNQLVEVLNQLLRTNIQAQYQANPIKSYVAQTLADTNKAKEILGFQARYSLEEGVKAILKSA